jgi:ribosomal protein S18 acetylase RimI-like enzyme
MIQIQTATLEELAIIRKIAYETWPSAYSSILSPAQIDYMLEKMYDLKTLENQLTEQGHVFLLATQNKIPLGFAGFQLNCQIPNCAKLHKIYLLPQAQGKGIGKLLLQEVLRLSQRGNQESIMLNVNKFNLQAIMFYMSQGFKESYREVIDIGAGFVMDDLVLKYDL